jgi:glycerate dehydrogenase
MKIVFLDAFTANPGDIHFNEIEALGDFYTYPRTRLAELAHRASDADIIITNKFRIDEDALRLMPNLKYIVVAATGYNNIDLDAVRNRHIPVSNVRGYSTESVVQHVFALILAIFNKIEYYDAQVKTGRWARTDDFCFYDQPILELAGKTMGIMGYGTIGQRVGQVAAAFGMKVIANVRTPKQVEGVQFVDIDALFAQSDILSLHCPLTPATTAIINKENIKKMKKTAVLINTGRGGLINEADLFYALDHGLLAGAGLDVLTIEPPTLHHLLVNHPRCIVTPHIAWASQQARIQLVAGIAENINNFVDGKPSNLIY